jgi:hypothetical protein
VGGRLSMRFLSIIGISDKVDELYQIILDKEKG